jgi:hypothetical protein
MAPSTRAIETARREAQQDLLMQRSGSGSGRIAASNLHEQGRNRFYIMAWKMNPEQAPPCSAPFACFAV